MSDIIQDALGISSDTPKIVALNENKNTIAKVIFVIGLVTFFVGFITGAILGNSGYEFKWSTAFLFWVSSFISGMVLIGFSEIIKLLDNINNKLDK